jgi:hypothetical protein
VPFPPLRTRAFMSMHGMIIFKQHKETFGVTQKRQGLWREVKPKYCLRVSDGVW